MTLTYAVTMVQNQKILDAPKDSGREIGRVNAGAKFTSLEKVGEYFKHPTGGWVCRWKSGTIALTFIPSAEPPIDPPPSPADCWGIVNISTDTTERKNDPATRPLTDARNPNENSSKGTPIQIKGWESFVKLINVPKSVAWLLAIGSQWINSTDIPLRAEQLCSSCSLVHVIGENATHYMIETLYNTADVSRLDRGAWNWLYKPWLFHQCLMRNGQTGVIYLVGSGKYVYYPLLRTESAPMWIDKRYVELLPTTLTDGRKVTAFRFLGASIYGMVDGEEVPLRLHPARDDFWQEPAWPLTAQGCIPPA